MKRSFQTFSVYLPLVILLAFSLAVLGFSVPGKRLCFEGPQAYSSEDIFGTYTYLSVQLPLESETKLDFAAAEREGQTLYFLFSPSVEGNLSKIENIQTEKTKGYLQGHVYKAGNETNYTVYLDFPRIRNGLKKNHVLDSDYRISKGSSPDEKRYYYYLNWNGRQLTLVDKVLATH